MDGSLWRGVSVVAVVDEAAETDSRRMAPPPDPVDPAADDAVARHLAAASAHTLVLLWRGDHRDQPEDEAERIQAAHLGHLVALQLAGHLVVNGPLLGDGDLRGVSIYRTDDTGRVRAWVDEDPAVRSGRLRAEVHPWFGVLPD